MIVFLKWDIYRVCSLKLASLPSRRDCIHLLEKAVGVLLDHLVHRSCLKTREKAFEQLFSRVLRNSIGNFVGRSVRNQFASYVDRLIKVRIKKYLQEFKYEKKCCMFLIKKNIKNAISFFFDFLFFFLLQILFF